MKKIISIIFVFLFSQLSATVYFKPPCNFKPRFEIAAVFIENNGRILILHRQENKSQGNKWGIPGGKVDKNELPLQAAIRELKEETAYDISKQEIENLGTVYIEYNDNDHFVYHMFRTKLQDNPGDVKINFVEHKGFTWVTPSDALKMDLLQDEDPCIRLIYFPTSQCRSEV